MNIQNNFIKINLNKTESDKAFSGMQALAQIDEMRYDSEIKE